MKDKSQLYILSTDNPIKELSSTSLDKEKDSTDDGIVEPEMRANQSSDNVMIPSKQLVKETLLDNAVTSKNELFQEFPLKMYESGNNRDSDATPLETLTICIDAAGCKKEMTKSPNHPLTSSMATKSFNETAAKNLTSTSTEEVELRNIVTTIDETEKLLTER